MFLISTGLKAVQLGDCVVEAMVLTGMYCTITLLFLYLASLSKSQAMVPVPSYFSHGSSVSGQHSHSPSMNPRGQTLEFVNVHFPSSGFSYGRYYVVLSRCPNLYSLKVLCGERHLSCRSYWGLHRDFVVYHN
jgi:hypothetical protein